MIVEMRLYAKFFYNQVYNSYGQNQAYIFSNLLIPLTVGILLNQLNATRFLVAWKV